MIIPLLSLYSKNSNHKLKNIWEHQVYCRLFIVAMIWKQLNCPTDQCIR